MATMIFVNLPVSDLERAKTFYQALGYTINPQFTDENAACVQISDTIFSMLLVRDFFQTFTDKPVADTVATASSITALTAESRADVDALADRALEAGGTSTKNSQDLGFMYSRSFGDPDGNLWEVLWMDPAHVE